jgi:hypothetical protein
VIKARLLPSMNACARQVLFPGRVRWERFRLATQAPEQVAGHDVRDHGKQHQKQRDPKNPAVVHPLPARTMRMSFVVLVIMLCFVHRFLAEIKN